MIYKLKNLKNVACSHCRQVHYFMTINCKDKIWDNGAPDDMRLIWAHHNKHTEDWEIVPYEWCPQKANYGYQQKSS